MITRHLYYYLVEWKNSLTRKPLILRGARQVGKTTLINYLGKSYQNYLYFNLEKAADKSLFNSIDNIETTIQLLFIARGKVLIKETPTLIFIDEVQENPKVIESLRYFYEDHPYLHVIVSGSLLEFAIEKIARTPVGRVEFAELHPVNFKEFIEAKSSPAILNLLAQCPLKNEFLTTFFDLFHQYVMVGGMPELLNNYIQEKNLSRLPNLYSSIIETYKSDIEKYAKNNTQKNVLRHIMNTVPFEIDNRITFNHFGQSDFKSREVKEALDALEKAKIIELMYPTTHVSLPVIPDFKKSPRLQYLDVGLANFQLGIQSELLTLKDLNDSSRGKLVQQVVVQEMKSIQYLPAQKIHFWVREEHGTSSEVDIVIPYKSLLIPIEVKSGASGSLRSLHEFMDRSNHPYALRFYAGNISVDNLKTRKGKSYKLLNLPYFLAAWTQQYLAWFITDENAPI